MVTLNFQSHDPSEIILIWWFDAQETYYYHQCWKQFLWKPWYIFSVFL